MNTNVAVYPVDARGLLGLPFADASKTVKVGKDGRHRWRDPESNSAVTYTLGTTRRKTIGTTVSQDQSEGEALGCGGSGQKGLPRSGTAPAQSEQAKSTASGRSAEPAGLNRRWCFGENRSEPDDA